MPLTLLQRKSKDRTKQIQIHKFSITYCFFSFWNFAETSIIANHRTEFHFMFLVPPWGFLVILWAMLLAFWSFPTHHSPPQQSGGVGRTTGKKKLISNSTVKYNLNYVKKHSGFFFTLKYIYIHIQTHTHNGNLNHA